MKRLVILLGLGGLAALPAMPGSCSLSNSACLSGMMGSKNPIPITADFMSPSPGVLDTLTITGITFNGNVVDSGTFSLVQSPTAGMNTVAADFSDIGFSSTTQTVTIGMTFTFTGPDTLSSNIGISLTDAILGGPVSVTGNISPISISEVVTISPGESLFSLTNLFEITPGDPAMVQSKMGGQQFNALGQPLFNPNSVMIAPEPMSLALVGMGLVGGASFAMRRRRREKVKNALG